MQFFAKKTTGFKIQEAPLTGSEKEKMEKSKYWTLTLGQEHNEHEQILCHVNMKMHQRVAITLRDELSFCDALKTSGITEAWKHILEFWNV